MFLYATWVALSVSFQLLICKDVQIQNRFINILSAVYFPSILFCPHLLQVFFFCLAVWFFSPVDLITLCLWTVIINLSFYMIVAVPKPVMSSD